MIVLEPDRSVTQVTLVKVFFDAKETQAAKEETLTMTKRNPRKSHKPKKAE